MTIGKKTHREVRMHDRIGSGGAEGKAATEGDIPRAAREYLESTCGVPERGKPGGTPREGRPRLRGAPAATAVIKGRG